MANDPPFSLWRPDIGACYCLPDAPDRCHWDRDRHEWVGPCWPPERTGTVGR
jgi:hypothetical protein